MKITVGTYAFKPKNGLHDTNLSQMLEEIERAATQGVQLVVFPEACLQGYRSGLEVSTRVESLKAAYEDSEVIPGGRSVQAIAELAKQHNIYVVYGLTEREKGYRIYNSAVLTGPEGHIGTYRKVHLGPGERYAWQPGDSWPVFDTELGRIGIMICYDKAWPEAARELALGGAEIILVPTAWPTTWAQGNQVAPELVWQLEQIRALENSVWVVTSNFAGEINETDYPGRAKIINPQGTVVAASSSQAEHELVIADIEVGRGIWEANAQWLGERLYRDRRPETYHRSAEM